MKKLIILLLLLVLTSCSNINEDNTKKWIENAQKPILCRQYGTTNGFNQVLYTLIDADGNVYSTGRIYFNLPDTLK